MTSIPKHPRTGYSHLLALFGFKPRVVSNGAIPIWTDECPKCGAVSGDDWTKCKKSCPHPQSPHFSLEMLKSYAKPPELTTHRDFLKIETFRRKGDPLSAAEVGVRVTHLATGLMTQSHILGTRKENRTLALQALETAIHIFEQRMRSMPVTQPEPPNEEVPY